jgi:EmrB/QacA subfamily drug resistance transporter
LFVTTHFGVEESAMPGFATRWKGLIFIGISLLVISLDNTILNIALPSLSRDLNANISDLQWIIDAYTLVFAALLLTMGAVSDRYGRKRALQIGLVMFGIGSLGAALSTTTFALILSRGFLGIAGAFIMPSTLSLINVSFPQRERAQAIGIWSAIFGLGIAIGPLLGGALLKFYTWHILFLINLPIIVIALVGGQRFLAESKDETAPKLDIPGVIFSSTGVFALVYAIIEAGSKGWGNPEVLGLFTIAFVLLAIFAVIESRTEEPMMPLYLFKNLSFSGASIALAMVMFSLAGSMFFVSQYMQTILGYDTLTAGLGTLPVAAGLIVVAPLSAPVSKRIGIKFTVALGIGIAALSLLFMGSTYKVDTPYVIIAAGQLLLAAGMGLAMAPATNSIMSAIPANKSGIGSAMNDTTRELGTALGVAVLGTFMNTTYINGVQGGLKLIPGFPKELLDAVSSSIQAAHAIAALPQVPKFMGGLIISTANQSFVNGMTHAMIVGAIIMACSATFVLVTLPSRIAQPVEGESAVAPEPELNVATAVGD